MKTSGLIYCALAVAGAVSAKTIEFASEAELENNVEIIEEGASGKTRFSTDPGAGGAPGRVEFIRIRGNSGEGLSTKDSFDPNEGAISASFMFLADEYSTEGSDSRVALGLSAGAKNLAGNAEVQARLLKKKGTDSAVFEIRGAKGGSTKANGVKLKDNNWYRLSVSFVPYGKQSFEVSAVLEDFGADGARTKKVVAEAQGIRTAPKDFFAGTDRLPVRVGTLVQSDGGGGRALDDFTVGHFDETK